METPVIREEVQAFAQACQAFAEFSQYNMNGLTIAEREVIGTSLAAALTNFPPID